MRELLFLFLRLGVTAFGGPSAHIAMMQQEVVVRRAWLTNEAFLDLLGAANLIPGPNSTELAIHIGHRRAGFPGLIVAGVSFIVPAALIVLAIAAAYVRYRSLPDVGAVLYGVKPVVIAVVLQAIYKLARTAVKTVPLAAVGILSAAAAALGANELAVLVGAGLCVVALRGVRGSLGHAVLSLPAASAAAVATAGIPFSMGALFLAFLKVGAVLFGSGYVLLAYLRADLVDRLHWLTESQLLDAVAVGQVTPGPVFTTATFVGYLLAGTPGALVATLGIFTPAFVFVALSGPVVPRLRRSMAAGAFLDGVNVASLALMAIVTWQLGRAALVDFPTIALAVSSSALLFFGVNSTYLVALGAAAGLLLKRVWQ